MPSTVPDGAQLCAPCRLQLQKDHFVSASLLSIPDVDNDMSVCAKLFIVSLKFDRVFLGRYPSARS